MSHDDFSFAAVAHQARGRHRPASGFPVESRYLLQPIPFSVRVYQIQDLFAGKMHALLCRRWATRIKGRDWYDLVRYVGQGTPLRLAHVEARMRQSGHYTEPEALSSGRLSQLLIETIMGLDVDQAREEATRFVSDPHLLAVWSVDFSRRRVPGSTV